MNDVSQFQQVDASLFLPNQEAPEWIKAQFEEKLKRIFKPGCDYDELKKKVLEYFAELKDLMERDSNLDFTLHQMGVDETGKSTV